MRSRPLVIPCKFLVCNYQSLMKSNMNPAPLLKFSCIASKVRSYCAIAYRDSHLSVQPLRVVLGSVIWFIAFPIITPLRAKLARHVNGGNTSDAVGFSIVGSFWTVERMPNFTGSLLHPTKKMFLTSLTMLSSKTSAPFAL